MEKMKCQDCGHKGLTCGNCLRDLTDANEFTGETGGQLQDKSMNNVGECPYHTNRERVEGKDE